MSEGRTLPGWGKDAALKEFSKGKTLKELTNKYALGVTARALEHDIRKWKKKDKEFEKKWNKIRDEKYGERYQITTDKPTQQPEKYGNWKIEFCAEYAATHDIIKACEKAPYSPSEVLRRLNPNDREYLPEFHEMVMNMESLICEEIKAGVMEDWRAEQPGKSRAWIGLKVLEAMDPRFSKKIHMTGQVEHRHKHGIEENTEKRLERLAEAQRSWRAQLPEPREIVDVEVVSESVDSGIN